MTRRQILWARILFGLYLVAVAVLCFGKFDSAQDVPRDLWGIPTDKIVRMEHPTPESRPVVAGPYVGALIVAERPLQPSGKRQQGRRIQDGMVDEQ